MTFQNRYSIGFTSRTVTSRAATSRTVTSRTVTSRIIATGIAAAGLSLLGLPLLSPAIAQPREQNLLLAETPVQMAQTSSLTGSWKLANMTAGNSPMPMLPASDNVPTAEFQDGRIAGSGGCNRFMGGYEAQENQLKIGPLASTFMACEPGVMNQESTYLKALQGAQRYEVTDDGLTIFYETEEGAGVLRFVAQTAEQTGSAATNGTVNESMNESTDESMNESTSQPPSQPVRGLW